MINNITNTYYICNTCTLPNKNKNYCTFDKKEIDFFIKRGNDSIPYLKSILENSKNEAQITEVLYILNRLIDSGVKDIDKLYPTLSKFNYTDSPNIQTFLAGIYRKTKIPDAFGPLISMLIHNTINQPKETYFDPNEEIGGAILDYLT